MGVDFRDRSAPLTKELEISGWCLITWPISRTRDFTDLVQIVAEKLGTIVGGRGGTLVEEVVPRTTSTAYAGSLSDKYGLGALPLHTDTAHWPTPCRYLVIGCADPGPKPTPTILLDLRQMRFSKMEASACDSAVFLIRNGRHSFYGHLRERDRSFFRVDPGCMTPLTSDGEIALKAFEISRNERRLHRHNWNAGEILVVDNWRVVHGRGGRQRTEHGRKLLRAMVR